MEINDRLLGAYAGLGLGHWHLGEEAKALDHLRMATRLEPNSALLFSEVARIRGQFKRGRAGAPDADHWIDDAANAYREQLDGHANHAQWHYQLGQLLSHAGDGAAATEHYREAVTINPAYQKAWIKLALLHGDAGESQEAFRAVGFALNPDAELIRLHYQLAIIFTLPTRFDICLDQLEGKADAKRPLADARANVQLALENLGLLDPVASGWQAAPPAQETPVA